MTSADLIAIVITLTILIAVGVYLLHWLYRHSSKDQSFVRTGSGGERVVMGGGALVIPIIHDITVVNMNAVPIEIRRQGEQSLITKNKIRIDLVTEFSVRVIESNEGVRTAARTLGARTQDPTALKEVIQGKLIDAMSTVAASMTMDEIHEGRQQFISQVSDIAREAVLQNGLELESASLTSLNQASLSYFDERNQFDAEGMTLIVKETEARRKLRNQIENETRVQISTKDFETEQRIIEIDRELEFSRIDQARDIEMKKAKQASEIETERSASQIAITEARIRTEEESERFQINKTRAVQEARIASDNEVKSLAIQRETETDIAEVNARSQLEKERLQSRQQIESERVAREQEVREEQIQSKLTVATFETEVDGKIENVRLATQNEVETARVNTEKSIELANIESERMVRITAQEARSEFERAEVTRSLIVETERLRMEEEVHARDIERKHKIKMAETASYREVEDARVVADREIDELRTAARRYIERFDIEQQMETELADKARLIAVVNKAIDEAVVRTREAEALQTLAQSEEQIESRRAEEKATRAKSVDIIDAETRAERESIRTVKMAEANKEASERRAEAEIAEARAAEFRYGVDAEGNRKLNEAENSRNDENRRSALLEGVVNRLPEIIREQVKPIENIDSIKILQVDGLPGLNSPTEGGGTGEPSSRPDGSVSDQVVSSAMKYRTQVAFVDGLMEEIGLPLKNLGSAGGMSFRNFPEPKDDKSES
ncbi:MAG: flotillin domain-containing protein [Pseudomonadota bacterium]|nr:flotillin domain-containing protein [Pseudomonadota bacterium]